MSAVSCLCVATGPLAQVKEAVRSWREQTYPDRELLIGARLPRLRRALSAFVGDEPAIRVVGENRIGELARAATGELACVWPAASTSHRERLEIQVRERRALGAAACTLADWIAADRASRELIWCHRPTAAHALSLLCTTAQFAAAIEPATHDGPAVELLDGVPLLAIRCEEDRDWRAALALRRDARFVRDRRSLLPDLLAGHRLARPHLIRLAGGELLDPYCGGEIDGD
jgi:hypothetical protein